MSVAIILQYAKNTAIGLVRRGRYLTFQTAFGGQLPYKGSLGRPAVIFDHSPFWYYDKPFRCYYADAIGLRATNH